MPSGARRLQRVPRVRNARFSLSSAAVLIELAFIATLGYAKPAPVLADAARYATPVSGNTEQVGWLLYTSESPVAHAAHGMIFGAVYTPSGERIASVAQEGLIRRKR